MQKLYAEKKNRQRTMNNTPPYRLILQRPEEHPDSIYHTDNHGVKAILTIMGGNKEDYISTHHITLKQSARHPNDIEWCPDNINLWLKHKVNPEEILEKYKGGRHLQPDRNGDLYTKLQYLNNTEKCSYCNHTFQRTDKIFPISTEAELKPDYMCQDCKTKRKTAKNL